MLDVGSDADHLHMEGALACRSILALGRANGQQAYALTPPALAHVSKHALYTLVVGDLAQRYSKREIRRLAVFCRYGLSVLGT